MIVLILEGSSENGRMEEWENGRLSPILPFPSSPIHSFAMIVLILMDKFISFGEKHVRNKSEVS